jgi:hypothetical protein
MKLSCADAMLAAHDNVLDGFQQDGLLRFLLILSGHIVSLLSSKTLSSIDIFHRIPGFTFYLGNCGAMDLSNANIFLAQMV